MVVTWNTTVEAVKKYQGTQSLPLVPRLRVQPGTYPNTKHNERQ